MLTMYCKLFSSLYQGTLRGRPDEILVFTNLLAHADAFGIVDKHFKAISEEVGLPISRVKAAVEVLEAPDPESRSPEEGGARLVKLDGHRIWGWKIVNYGKYRAIKNEDDRREQNRLAQERWRNKNKPPSARVSSVSPDKPPSAQAEAEGEAEAMHEREHGSFAERPSLEEVKFYASTIGLGAWKAEDWFQEMEGCGWLDFNKRPIAKWQAVLQRVRTKWEADGRPTTPPPARNGANGAPEAKDTFWKDTKRLEQVDGEIRAIEGRAAHTALDVIIQPQDKEKHQRLKKERKTLKEKLGL